MLMQAVLESRLGWARMVGFEPNACYFNSALQCLGLELKAKKN